MYTQCPECGTVFRVTADVLRMAQGDVRCGICSGTFNALEYLSDEAAARPAYTPAHDDTITVEELPGHEFIEMESDGEELPEAPPEPSAADAIAEGSPELDDLDVLEAPVEEWDDATSGIVAEESDPHETEMVDLPSTLASDDDGDAALEFHGTEEDLARLFVEAEAPRLTAIAATVAANEAAAGSEATSAQPDDLEPAADAPARGETEGSAEDGGGQPAAALEAANVAAAEGPVGAPLTAESAGTVPPAGEPEAIDSSASLDRTDEFPILVLDERDEDGSAAAAPPADTDGYRPPPPIPIPAELRAAHSSPSPGAGDAGPTILEQLGLREERRERTPALWTAAVAVLALALVMQLVHYNRDALAKSAVAGPLLAQAYAVLGLELDAPVDLSAFEVRQWGAATDATSPGTLRMRASIANRASFPQPYPLLRLAMQDRFGNTVGMRDLQPQEYLPGKRVRERLLGAGQRADAEVSIVDPGSEAVGFELDVCVPVGASVRCAGNAGTR